MPVPPLAHDPAATPVAVVLGGPSAEHDVSIVSGSAIADALVASGYPVETWLIDLGGDWWRLPGRLPARRPAPGGLRRPGRARGGGAVRRRPGPRAARGARGPAGRLPRPPRPVRRGRHRAGPVRGGRARLHGLRRDRQRGGHGQGRVQAARARPRPARDRLGRDPRRALGRGPGRRAGRARGVRGRGRGPAAHGQAGPPRQLGGHDPRPCRGGAGGGPRRGVPLRRPGAGRALPRRRPGPRGVRAGQRARRDRALRPGRDQVRPRVLRLRGEVHARRVGDDASAPRSRRSSGRRCSSSRATPTAPSARRASPGSTSCSPARPSSCPRSTRSRASRRSACSPRCAPRAATTSPRSAAASWTLPSRATGRGSGTASPPADLPR